jgi:hypothetical protein
LDLCGKGKISAQAGTSGAEGAGRKDFFENSGFSRKTGGVPPASAMRCRIAGRFCPEFEQFLLEN